MVMLHNAPKAAIEANGFGRIQTWLSIYVDNENVQLQKTVKESGWWHEFSKDNFALIGIRKVIP